jgi:PleD family two-component response regulator
MGGAISSGHCARDSGGVGEVSISYSASIGVALLTPVCLFEQVMLQADSALYQAKKTRCNQVVGAQVFQN